MKTRTTLTLTALVLFSMLVAWAGVAQQGAAPKLKPGPGWVTVHDYGVQVRISPPAQGAQNYLLEVIDLQIDVPGLRQDLQPTSASVFVQGKGLRVLEQTQPHILSVELPVDWAEAAAMGGSACKVMHGTHELINFELDSLLL